MKVTVTRAFLLGGKPHQVGETVEVSDHLGRELIHLAKAKAAAALPSSGPMTTKSTAALVSGSKPEAAAAPEAPKAAPAAKKAST